MTEITDLGELGLWPHQDDAVRTAREYIESFTEENQKSGLIQMPTGTGKSGVMAVLSRNYKEASPTLIVTPWKSLRDQLRLDISHRFWEDALDVDPPRPAKVRVFRPSSANQLFEEITSAPDCGVVLLCTHHTLWMLRDSYVEEYQRLKEAVRLVLVDEGHREPAPEWSKAIRRLQCPTVLFTATPYRNDQKLFNVDPNHRYVYTFCEAEDENYVRNVRFRPLEFGDNAQRFVDGLVDFYDGKFQEHAPDVETPRVIIRCEEYQRVQDIATRLEDKGKSVLALHERFRGAEKENRKAEVPDVKTVDATFWVHQYKLLEGVDNPEFTLLAIYDPFKNARSLVQQVGRVIRNVYQREEFAVVLADPDHGQKVLWQGYYRHEREVSQEEDDSRHLQPYQRIARSQPKTEYFGRKFRERFEPTREKDLHNEIEYRFSANIFKGEDIVVGVLMADVADEWEGEDRQVLASNKPDEDTALLVYASARNSPILKEKIFLEVTLGYTILRESGDYLFYYDSQGLTAGSVKNAARSVSVDRLRGLFAGGSSRISNVSLLNTDVGQNSIRRRSLWARAINNTAPRLEDHAYVPSTAVGYTSQLQPNERVRRYVGFSRGRISDGVSKEGDYYNYIRWLDEVASVLEEADDGDVEAFRRYAVVADEPDDPTPANILLDIEDVRDSLYFTDAGRHRAKVPDVCFDIEQNCFTLTVNGDQFDVEIKYYSDAGQYRLKCEALNRKVVISDSEELSPERGLITYLNKQQAFRVIPSNAELIYAHSQFYEPSVPIGEDSSHRMELLDVFSSMEELDDCTTEKGREEDEYNSGWPSGSVFGLIDSPPEGSRLYDKMVDCDILVCDDGGSNEAADFIAADTEEKFVSLIHAKAGNGEQWSASIFQEVCAQAVKNASYLSPNNQQPPPNVANWDSAWRSNGRVVDSRIRRGPNDGVDIWERVRGIVRSPGASREIWIIMGNAFSLEAFREQVNSEEPPSEVMQLLFLLRSTWSAISEVGADLRIFCGQ